jgi:hypothetical protein
LITPLEMSWVSLARLFLAPQQRLALLSS